MNKLGVSIAIIIAFIFVVYMVLRHAKPAERRTSVATEDKTDTSSENHTLPPNGADDLKMTIIKQGTGETVVKSGDTIAVRYKGYFTDGTVFDDNLDATNDFTFTIGQGNVIQGWEIGLQGMKVGEARKLTIPPEYGYGPSDYGPIPGNSTLIFEVELKAIK